MTRKATSKKSEKQISPEWPVWYNPMAPLGSAVRYIASLSPHFNWVGIYHLKKKGLKLGPSIGTETRPEQTPMGSDVRRALAIPILNPSGKPLGEIRIDKDASATLEPKQELSIRQIAERLGELWPE